MTGDPVVVDRAGRPRVAVVRDRQVVTVASRGLQGRRGDPGPKGDPGPAGDDAGAVLELIDQSITTHVQAPEPHPAYDDMEDLANLLQNRLT